MHSRIFLRDKLVTARNMSSVQFHEQVLIIEFPNAGIQFQEQVAVGKIAEEQAALPVANKIFIVTKYHIHSFGNIEGDQSPCVKIIVACLFESFVLTCAW